MNEHTSTEAPSLYGELYYSADDVRAILRVVAEHLEADQRWVVLDISSALPSTMPWHGFSGDLEQPAYFSTVCRHVQLGIQYDTILNNPPIRLTALLRRGPIAQRQAHGQHTAGMASQP